MSERCTDLLLVINGNLGTKYRRMYEVLYPSIYRSSLITAKDESFIPDFDFNSRTVTSASRARVVDMELRLYDCERTRLGELREELRRSKDRSISSLVGAKIAKLRKTADGRERLLEAVDPITGGVDLSVFGIEMPVGVYYLSKRSVVRAEVVERTEASLQQLKDCTDGNSRNPEPVGLEVVQTWRFLRKLPEMMLDTFVNLQYKSERFVRRIERGLSLEIAELKREKEGKFEPLRRMIANLF